MSQERTVVLRFGEHDGKERTLTVATSFSQDEIDEVISVINDQMPDEFWDDSDKIIPELEAKGYIRIIGPGPEVMDLMI